MTWFIFIGDLVVMAGLITAAVWVFLRANPADLNAAARIPLEDDGDAAGTPTPGAAATTEAKPHA